MPVPFEALLPFGIIIAMFSATGAGLSSLRYWRNGGKRQRWHLDTWDRQMMDRDRRLTGSLRGQMAQATAPPGFDVNNPWRVSERFS